MKVVTNNNNNNNNNNNGGGGGAISRVHNSKIMWNFCLSTDCHGRWGMNLTTHLHLAPQLTCVVLLPPPPHMPSWHIQEQPYTSGWALSS